MSTEERRRLTWEDATERFLDAAELKSGERPKPIEEACDRLAWKAFNAVSGEPPPSCPVWRAQYPRRMILTTTIYYNITALKNLHRQIGYLV